MKWVELFTDLRSTCSIGDVKLKKLETGSSPPEGKAIEIEYVQLNEANASFTSHDGETASSKLIGEFRGTTGPNTARAALSGDLEIAVRSSRALNSARMRLRQRFAPSEAIA